MVNVPFISRRPKQTIGDKLLPYLEKAETYAEAYVEKHPEIKKYLPSDTSVHKEELSKPVTVVMKYPSFVTSEEDKFMYSELAKEKHRNNPFVFSKVANATAEYRYGKSFGELSDSEKKGITKTYGKLMRYLGVMGEVKNE